MQNQENILKIIYFDPSGFQSQQQLYSEAKKQDKHYFTSCKKNGI